MKCSSKYLAVPSFLAMACGDIPAEAELGSTSQAVYKGTSIVKSAVVQVTILLPDRSRSRCSGTKINEKFVLTAAHCFEGLPVWSPEAYVDRDGDVRLVFARDVNVSLGETVTAGAVPAIAYADTARVYIPRDYRIKYGGSIENDREAVRADVALLHLDSGRTPNWESSATVALHADHVGTGAKLSIYGYGHNLNGNATQSGVLRTGQNGARIKVSWSGNRHFKAKAGTARACRGDSGGPAIRENDTPERLIGVHSAAERLETQNCLGKRKAMFYTEINNEDSRGGWVDWIESIYEAKTGAKCATGVSERGYQFRDCG